MDNQERKPNIFFRLQEYVGLLFFTLMCVLLFLQLLSRYIFDSPLLFTEEFSRLAYVWVAFLGMAVAHRRRDHIRIELFQDMLPAGAKKTLDIFIQLASIAILGYLCYWGVEYMIFNQWNVAASVDFPLYYVYAALPVGCVLAIINIVCNFFSKQKPAE